MGGRVQAVGSPAQSGPRNTPRCLSREMGWAEQGEEGRDHGRNLSWEGYGGPCLGYGMGFPMLFGIWGPHGLSPELASTKSKVQILCVQVNECSGLIHGHSSFLVLFFGV